MAGRPPNDADKSRNGPGEPREQGDSGQDSSFGSFISDSVRRSAGQFRQDGAPSRRRRRASEEAPEGERPRRRTFRPKGEPAERPARSRRPSERQQRPIAAADMDDAGQAPPDDQDAPDRITGQEVLDEVVARLGGPQNALIALGVLVVALIALIWLLTSVLGGDDGDNETGPTPTETLQVLPVGGVSTPADGEPGEAPTAPEPTRSVIPTLPPVDLTGGSDNVLDQSPDQQQEDPPPEETPLAERGEPSASCSVACLARIERTSDAERVLASAGTRSSFTGDDWLWFTGQPDQVDEISRVLDTTVIRESDDTLRLYMAQLPGPGQVEWAASGMGEVIDSVGTYRLVEVPTAPANVRAALDAGLVVEKVAPAPPEAISRPENSPSLEDDQVGGLAAQVDSGRLEALMVDLQASSSTDGSGVGTRHYTTPGSQIAAERLYRELESYGFNVWYEDFVTWQGLLVVNVIGELPGRDTSRIYGVMAHFDSISDQPGAVAPGADDNATGVAGALEIARVLSDYSLRYSFRVAFVNVEEEGIIGAEQFARNALEREEPWEGVFNLDSIGSPRHGNHIYLNASGDSVWMMELIQRVNSAYGAGVVLSPNQSNDIVADDNRLREMGMESVLIARELYGMSPYHHSADDVIENASVDQTRSATALILLTVASLMF